MSFKNAFDETMGHEGGYVNDPDDPGGETYRGISRVHHPEWVGWTFVDNHGPDDAELDPMVRDFYYSEYWTPWRGDEIDNLSGDIAVEMFDTSVNQGLKAAVSYLQDGLNVLNRNQSLYQDIKVDGSAGALTLNALRHYLRNDGWDLLYKVMNILQGDRYIEIMRSHPSQEKYARGWFNRVTIRKRR